MQVEVGWGWDQPWCRRRDRAWSLRARLGARKPLLLQPVLLQPVRLLRLLPVSSGVLSASVLLSARTELLEPPLRILLRLLSSGSSPGARADGVQFYLPSDRSAW